MPEDYPECAKMRAVQGEANTLSEFWDWLLDEGYHLATYQDVYHPDILLPAHVDPNELFARFFGIDLEKVEREKQAILEAFRATAQSS